MDDASVRTGKFKIIHTAFAMACFLLSPVSFAGGIYVSAILTDPYIDSGYIPEKYEGDPGASNLGGKLSIGKALGEHFLLEGYYTEAWQLTRYKVDELDGFARDVFDVMDTILFGLLDPNQYVDVDTAIQSMGINAKFAYRLLYIKTGVSKWSSVVDVTTPDGAVTSMSDDGVGYNYGVGLKVKRGRHWAFIMELEKYHLDDVRARMTGFGVEYSF